MVNEVCKTVIRNDFMHLNEVKNVGVNVSSQCSRVRLRCESHNPEFLEHHDAPLTFELEAFIAKKLEN